jgi:hypothetical protein
MISALVWCEGETLCLICRHFFSCGEGLRSRCYGRTAALRLLVQPCNEDERWSVFFFNFYKQWSIGGMKLTGENRSTRGKTCPNCHFVHHKSHLDWPGIEISVGMILIVFLWGNSTELSVRTTAEVAAYCRKLHDQKLHNMFLRRIIFELKKRRWMRRSMQRSCRHEKFHTTLYS